MLQPDSTLSDDLVWMFCFNWQAICALASVLPAVKAAAPVGCIAGRHVRNYLAF